MATADDPDVASIEDTVEAIEGAPAHRTREVLDVADLPPPQPLVRTLERVAELDDDTVLVQRNDRAPRHLYPKLDDRGYRHATIEWGDDVVTAIWHP